MFIVGALQRTGCIPGDDNEHLLDGPGWQQAAEECITSRQDGLVLDDKANADVTVVNSTLGLEFWKGGKLMVVVDRADVATVTGLLRLLLH